MSHSAEYYRGAMAALAQLNVTSVEWKRGPERMIYDQQLEYRVGLQRAEARESAPDAAAISADRAWIDGAKFGWNCETKTDLHEAISNRQQQIREENLNVFAPDAAAVKAAALRELKMLCYTDADNDAVVYWNDIKAEAERLEQEATNVHPNTNC